MDKERTGEGSETDPPLIGKCAKFLTEILASHPYSWCIKCNEPLTYRINMQRRPIIYGTTRDWFASVGVPEKTISKIR
jgi:hypothetical protein